MLVFRSEAHVDRWLAGRPRGAVVPIVQLAELASAWWGDRLAPDWQPIRVTRTRQSWSSSA
jgi:hypothetical protein